MRPVARALLLVAAAMAPASGAETSAPALKSAAIPGAVLHYVERGRGSSVVFVHGSLSDGGYWSDEVAFFGRTHRAVAYSRRYDSPNDNEIRPGYSAVADADDLAALSKKLGLGRMHVVGHSYGALTALFLAVRHPELVASLVLAEAPAVTLLGEIRGEKADAGKAMLADIESRMLRPMQEAFRKGEREAGVRAFMAYVFRDAGAWDRMPESARRETMKNAREWEAMLTTGELFPRLDPEAVRGIRAPALILSGERSYPFLTAVDDELARLLPDSRRTIVTGAGHQMWLEKPEACRRAVVEFWEGVAAPSTRLSAAPGRRRRGS
jgi:pimeloyl-ACP methyl ester carboxylesterase